jgi:hypothetical protein
MAYDTATGQLVLFGGEGTSAILNDTWTWNGTTWKKQSPTTSPSARYWASMAYDTATGQLVLFGGEGTSAILDDTWTWNGTTWKKQSPTTSPSARDGASMAYDTATGQLVLFGGFGTSAPLDDTWTWNGTTWTKLSPTTSPSARYGASMAYDSATGQLVLFGGVGVSGGLDHDLDDTWTWNGATWKQLSPTTSPSARDGASMAYDTATGQSVLFGGEDFNAFPPGLDDTWTWNGTTWKQQSPTTSPSTRDYAAMAYDTATGQLVLFGGNPYINGKSGSYPNDTWTYSGIPTAAAFTSAASYTTPSGSPFTYTVTTTGLPTPAITLASGSSLPAGVSLTDHGNGTATLAGTSSVATGTYHFSIQGKNTVNTVTQKFTLVVDQPPAITSKASASFTIGTAKTFTVTTTGYPKSAVTESGALPSGITFTNATLGKGTLSGTAAAGTAGTYPIMLKATSSAGTISQSFTLTVKI